ncbi:MAG: hypothetical protein D6705_10175 [Deltaproteobacteria bacterium]|nr:MAG: hypothetical protein D6705_10175 [Deltaproteobacteria bacterium]
MTASSRGVPRSVLRAVEILRHDATLHADALAGELASRLDCVAWDRAHVIGTMLGRLDDCLARARAGFSRAPRAQTVHVHERFVQPLDALPLVADGLLRGERVRCSWDPGVEGASVVLLEQLAERADGRLALLGPGTVAANEIPGTPWVGPVPARERVAFVESRADPELSAYVLARACLRRSGRDPRAVRLAWVATGLDRLERHLRRLFTETLFGPPDDPTVFAGPVDAGTRDAYLEAVERWTAMPGVETIVPGGLLERAGDRRIYLAPALFRAGPDHAVSTRVGPMLVLVAAPEEICRAKAVQALSDGRDVLHVVGGATTPDRAGLPDERVTRVLGALLSDRLPPGLPEPRPV